MLPNSDFLYPCYYFFRISLTERQTELTVILILRFTLSEEEINGEHQFSCNFKFLLVSQCYLLKLVPCKTPRNILNNN